MSYPPAMVSIAQRKDWVLLSGAILGGNLSCVKRYICNYVLQ